MTGLQALLVSLRAAPWAHDAVSELHAVLPDAADTLKAALHAHADAAACESVVAALFGRAEEGVGWTEPFWRESYVLACAVTAVALCAAPGGDRQRALRHLDCAFIMGGPPEVLQPFVAEVEPLVPRVVTIDSHLLPRSLPDGEAPELLAARLCRLDSGEWGRFRKEFYNVDAPVVLAGLGAAWPALEKWRDLGFWDREFGHRYVPLEVGKHSDGAAWREEVAPMREFLAALAAGTRVLYLAQHTLFEHLPVVHAPCACASLLACAYAPSIAPLAAAWRLRGARLRGPPPYTHQRMAWLARHSHALALRQARCSTPARSSACTLSLALCLSYDGLLTQVVGFKYVRLYPASNTPFLYRTKVAWAQQRRWPDAAAEDIAAADDGQGTISLVDVEHPDLERFPLFQHARCMETVLVRTTAPVPRQATSTS